MRTTAFLLLMIGAAGLLHSGCRSEKTPDRRAVPAAPQRMKAARTEQTAARSRSRTQPAPPQGSAPDKTPGIQAGKLDWTEQASRTEQATGKGIDIDNWVVEVRSASRKGSAALPPVMKRVDPAYEEGLTAKATFFDGKGQRPAPFAGVQVFRGQMDDDAEPEAVVQIRHHAREFREYEREEAFWIGVFDGPSGDMKLCGKVHQVISHCGWDNARFGLLLGFTQKKPGPGAALWIRFQQSSSCGTYVAYEYKKKQYRVSDKGLQVRSVKAPQGVQFDRSSPP